MGSGCMATDWAETLALGLPNKHSPVAVPWPVWLLSLDAPPSSLSSLIGFLASLEFPEARLRSHGPLFFASHRAGSNTGWTGRPALGAADPKKQAADPAFSGCRAVRDRSRESETHSSSALRAALRRPKQQQQSSRRAYEAIHQLVICQSRPETDQPVRV